MAKNVVEKAPPVNIEQVKAELRYPHRECKTSTWLTINALTRARDDDKPTVKVALHSDNAREWRATTKKGVEILEKIECWNVIDMRKNTRKNT